MGVVGAMRQPMTLQTNTIMIMREQARRYLASKWPLFTVFVFITVIVKSLRGDGANWPYLLITTNTLFFQLSNRTLDLNKLLMLKEITKIQERKEFYLVISSLYTWMPKLFLFFKLSETGIHLLLIRSKSAKPAAKTRPVCTFCQNDVFSFLQQRMSSEAFFSMSYLNDAFY